MRYALVTVALGKRLRRVAMNRPISLPDDVLKLTEQFADLEYLKQKADRASEHPDVEPEECDRF